jgi:CheY-like chemotaxis protein
MYPQATTSPTQALQWIRWGEAYNIAILDMQMPEMDGHTLAREIRSHRSRQVLPLVLLTSVGSASYGEGKMGELFDAALNKPIKSSHLHNTLMSIFSSNDDEEHPLPHGKQQRTARETHPHPHPLRILVAEDHAVNQRVALRLLKRLGYRADVAANGIEVLDALKRQPYDVVLMDVQMPEMDGEETARHIRASFPALQQPRIIAVTAHAIKGSRERYLAAGMDDYISKPVRLEELSAVLGACSPLPERNNPAETTDHPPLPQPAPLDQEVISELLDVEGETEREEMREIISLFLESTPDLIAHLRQALDAGDPQQLRRAAHTLKSSSQMGASGLAAIAALLQDKGDNANFEGVPDLINQLEAEYQRVEAAFGEIVQTLRLPTKEGEDI